MDYAPLDYKHKVIHTQCVESTGLHGTDTFKRLSVSTCARTWFLQHAELLTQLQNTEL